MLRACPHEFARNRPNQSASDRAGHGASRWGTGLHVPGWLACLVATTACTVGENGAPARIEVRDSAGIEIVTNTLAAPDTVRVHQPVLRIGSDGLDASEAYVFQLISDLAVTDNKVFVIDNRGRRIAVFDMAGAWQYDIGREGTGPGEHRGPITIALREDTVLVWDAIARRLNRFMSDGRFLDMLLIRDRYGRAPIAPQGAGYIDEIEWGQHMDPAPAGAAIVRRSAVGEITDTLVGPYPIPEIGWQWTDDSRQTGMMINPPAFSVRAAWTVNGSALFWSQPETGEVRILNAYDGSLQRIIRLGNPATETTTADREAHVDASIQRYNIDPSRRSAILEGTTFAAMRPAFVTFLIDDRDNLWIVNQDPGRPERQHMASTWNVIDAEGRLRRTIQFPESFELVDVHGGRAYGVTRDADGVEVVDVFDVSGETDG